MRRVSGKAPSIEMRVLFILLNASPLKVVAGKVEVLVSVHFRGGETRQRGERMEIVAFSY